MSRYSDEQLHLAARLYYVDGLGQTEVARLVRVSQSKVSRLLSLAREKGIVRITVADYDPRQRLLENRLMERFHLKVAVVIKVMKNLPSDESRRIVAHFSAPLIETLIPPGSILAMGGGRALQELVNELPLSQNGSVIVQAMGGVDSNVAPFDAHELGQTLAKKWNGRFIMLNAPAVLPDKRTRDAFLALDQIRSVLEKLEQANIALVGVGTLDNTVFVERNVFGAEGMETFKKKGAVGEICGRYFDSAGRECETSFRDRIIGIDLNTLRKIPQVIALAVGEDRAAAVAAAIQGGVVKSLITDELCAQALLSLAQDGK